MAIRATVRPLPDPGHAILRLTELDASPEGLALSIQRQQGPDSHLADDGWRRTEAWLLPAHVERIGDILEFHLGPEICDQLAGVATVRLRVKEPDIGVVGTTVVAWPTMLTSGAAGDSGAFDDTVRLRRRAAPQLAEQAPVFVPEPEPVVEPLPDLKAERDLPPPVVARRGLPAWATALITIIVLGGIGAYAWTAFKKPEEQVAVTPPAAPSVQAELPKKSIRDVVGEYLAANPAPEAMLAKGREFAQAGEMNGAFLVWRRAAEAGNVPAQVETAAFYDPVTPQPKGAFTADGTTAAGWYERAALAGSSDAQRRLGLLLAKGGGGLTADAAKAKTWLQQAAAQNDADAKKALETLPK
jgi:hypothetical protein